MCDKTRAQIKTQMQGNTIHANSKYVMTKKNHSMWGWQDARKFVAVVCRSSQDSLKINKFSSKSVKLSTPSFQWVRGPWNPSSTSRRRIERTRWALCPAMRISCDDNIVIQLSYLFQNIVKISLSSKFWRYHTIFNYEILAYFSLTWTCESKINCIIFLWSDMYQQELVYFVQLLCI